jgi:hypothetical protein
VLPDNQSERTDGGARSGHGTIRLMSRHDQGQSSPGPTGDFERAVPDIDGQPAIADTIYAATEEIEHAAPEMRARADSIADVVGPLVHVADRASLLIGDPDPAALLPDDQAEQLATLLTDTAEQANSLASVLIEAAEQAEGLAAVLTDEHRDPAEDD